MQWISRPNRVSAQKHRSMYGSCSRTSVTLHLRQLGELQLGDPFLGLDSEYKAVVVAIENAASGSHWLAVQATPSNTVIQSNQPDIRVAS